MAQRAPWTPSRRPTQGSSSTRPRHCPLCTARACCNSRAQRAARRKVGARPACCSHELRFCREPAGPHPVSAGHSATRPGPSHLPAPVTRTCCVPASDCHLKPAHGLCELPVGSMPCSWKMWPSPAPSHPKGKFPGGLHKLFLVKERSSVNTASQVKVSRC